MSLASYLARRSLHYGWLVAGLTFIALLVAAGIRSAPGVLIVPLEQEFGWTRATISLAISINLVLYGLIGPFAATLMERIGIRRTMVFSLAFVAIGVGLTTLMSASWQLVLLWGIIVGSGTGIIALVLGAVVVNRWFSEQRGLVLGVLTASTATGQLVFLPMLASLVEHFGWRVATLTLSGVALLVIPLIAIFMRVRVCEAPPSGLASSLRLIALLKSACVRLVIRAKRQKCYSLERIPSLRHCAYSGWECANATSGYCLVVFSSAVPVRMG